MPHGHSQTQITRSKIGLTLFGRKKSIEHINNMKGHSVSSETRKKISEAQKGKKNHAYGKKQSIEFKQMMSKKMMGRPFYGGMTNKKHSIETRLKMRESSKKGEANHSWRGGITPENKRIFRSMEYKLWREAVFKRDNYVCVVGGKAHGNNIQADHIKSFAKFPNLRFVVNNGRTLCVDCHRKTDTYGVKSRINKSALLGVAICTVGVGAV